MSSLQKRLWVVLLKGNKTPQALSEELCLPSLPRMSLATRKYINGKDALVEPVVVTDRTPSPGGGGVWPQACCTEDGFRAWDFILPTMLVDSRREERRLSSPASQLLFKRWAHGIDACALGGGILPPAGLTSLFSWIFKKRMSNWSKLPECVSLPSVF